MTGAARAIASQGLKRRALSLGAVKAFDHALQFLLPGDGATAPTGIATESSETLGGLPGLTFENSPPGSVPQALAYVIPFSAAINPEGYTYQTIGSFLVVPGQVLATPEELGTYGTGLVEQQQAGCTGELSVPVGHVLAQQGAVERLGPARSRPTSRASGTPAPVRRGAASTRSTSTPR